MQKIAQTEAEASLDPLTDAWSYVDQARRESAKALSAQRSAEVEIQRLVEMLTVARKREAELEQAYVTEHKAVDDIWKMVDPFATADIDIAVRTQDVIEMVRCLKERADKMRPALEPFANLAERDVGQTEADHDRYRGNKISVGDLRRASNAFYAD